MVEALKNDADYVIIDGDIHVTIDDFEGFDDDWDEIFRDYDDFDAVENFLDLLDDTCIEKYGYLYKHYVFDDFEVILGYTSFDI